MKNYTEFVTFLRDGMHGVFDVSGPTFISCIQPFTDSQVAALTDLGKKYKQLDSEDWQIDQEQGFFSFLIESIQQYHRTKKGEVSKKYNCWLIIDFLEDLAKLDLPIDHLSGPIFSFTFSHQ